MKNYMNMPAIKLSYLPKNELVEAWKNGYLTWDKMSEADDIRWEREVSNRKYSTNTNDHVVSHHQQIAQQNVQIAMQQAENANRIAMDMHQHAVDAANQAVQLHNIMFNMF